MKQTLLSLAAALPLFFSPLHSFADTAQLDLSGSGISGVVNLSYGTAADPKSGGLAATGIAGSFSDTNLGITDALIIGLQPLNPSAPEPTNLLAPDAFSHFNVASGLPHGFISYDNLFYPAARPRPQAPTLCTAASSTSTVCSSNSTTATWLTCGATAPRTESAPLTTASLS